MSIPSPPSNEEVLAARKISDPIMSAIKQEDDVVLGQLYYDIAIELANRFDLSPAFMAQSHALSMNIMQIEDLNNG